MEEVKFRLAKPSDAHELAEVHWRVRDRYTQGFFLSLGKAFLRTYYRIVLDDPYEVVVCAEKLNGKIVGFSSGTLNAEAQMLNLRKHKFKLAFAALGGVIKNPHRLKDIIQRYRSIDKQGDRKFINTFGARGEYWCWLKEEECGLSSLEVGHIRESIMYDLGCREMYFEVDKFNKRVYNLYSKIEKSELIEEITLPDGRERGLFKKKLTPFKEEKYK